jgi:hypothetical protein
MKRRILVLAAIVAGTVVGACSKQGSPPSSQPSSGQGASAGLGAGGGPMGRGGGPMGKGAGSHPGCPAGSGPLSDVARAAVEHALVDERAAASRYEAIERAIGSVMPFRQVERAERRHVWALEQLFVAHGAEPPAVATGVAITVKASSLPEACALGVESEKRNIVLYDELLKADVPPDVRCVFEHLQAASRERHLPTFTRCAGTP